MPWWPDIPNVSEYTRPATWEDVKNLARLLNNAGVQYALVGGYAIAALLSQALSAIKNSKK